MTDTRIRNFLLGTLLVGGLATGGASCGHKKTKEQNKEEPKTEVQAPEVDKKQNDPYGNIALFEATRNKIKFALAIVENYYPYTYKDGYGNWTTAEGLTELWDDKGNCTKVTKDTKPLTIAESDKYKDNYLTFSLLPRIKKSIKVPMDENELIAECVLAYCVGPKWISNSEFTKQINAGKKGKELANYLTGFRTPDGVPKRMYFLAALIAGEIQWSDVLDLRAEGCYELKWEDIFVYKPKGGIKRLPGNYYEWNFQSIKKHLETAKKPRGTTIQTKDGPKTVKCELAKDIVPDYVWQDVSRGAKKAVKESVAKQNEQPKTIDFTAGRASLVCDEQNDESFIAYQSKDYKTALKAAKNALKLAQTNKQRGAAYYNLGITYAALGQYNHAVKNLQNSLVNNETQSAKRALAEAEQKRQQRQEQNRKTARNVALGALGLGALYGLRRYYVYSQKHK